MAQRHPLKAQLRDVFGKNLSSSRLEGKIPGNVYASNEESTAIWVNEKELTELLKTAKESTLIDLFIESESKARPAIIRTLQQNVVKPGLQHISIQQINLKEKISAVIPLMFIGEPEIITNKLGVIDTQLNEIEVESLPSDLPENITIDISGFTEVGSAIKIKDVTPIKNVEFLSDSELTIVQVVAIAEDEPEEETASADATAEEAETAASESTEKETTSKE
ncbi:MAG: 50S ribosomal protein L25 [bacterium]|nr:50S ribosomal protein L25 [bacterium]